MQMTAYMVRQFLRHIVCNFWRYYGHIIYDRYIYTNDCIYGKAIFRHIVCNFWRYYGHIIYDRYIQMTAYMVRQFLGILYAIFGAIMVT